MQENILSGLFLGTAQRFYLKLSGWQASLGVSVLLVLFYNRSFWSEIFKVVPPSAGHLVFISALFLFVVLFLQVCLLVLSMNYVFKPVVIFILLTASLAAYFMDQYGIMIDRGMVQNTLGTDTGEVRDLLSSSMFTYLFTLGVVPVLLVSRLKLQYQPLKREGLTRLGLIGLNLLIMAGLLFSSYGNFIDLGKNHKYVRHMINPVNFIYATTSYTSRTYFKAPKTIQPIGLDAKVSIPVTSNRKNNLFVLVVGETARAKNFSLNGYDQQTNPKLSQEDIFNFTDVSSCGTATAYSLPCMFSPLGRLSYKPSRAKHSEGLLDVLLHAGVNVLWRDNQSGCKGVCERVPHESMSGLKVENLCEDGACFDMVMLEGLQHRVEQTKGDMFIVLHQMGSHGPAYYRRYPEEFAVFSPECKSSQLQLCSPEEVVNSYNNTILYTDFFLSQVIAFLKDNTDEFNTAMLYVSDHGESLGETNIYLHGLPYLIAPKEQKHVPFMLWLSDPFMAKQKLQANDLIKRQNESLSHDNIFHTALGAMGVETELYDRSLDLLAPDVN